MNTCLKSSFSALTLALTVAGCSTVPFWQPPPASKTPVAKAPIVERNTRRPPGYPAQPSSSYPQTEARPLPQDDPLLPREYSSTYPRSDPDAAPARPYSQSSEGGTYRQPTYPRTGNNTTQSPAYPYAGNTTQPPAYPPAGNTTQPPAYPPGAAASQPYYPTAPADDGYGRPPAPTYPTAPQNADTRYGAAPTPGSLPEPQPVVPRASSTATRPSAARPPAPEHTAVATAPPAAAVEPAPAPVQPTAPRPPAPPPADLPPAEITREGNQAVVALLESADKSVKSNQLDKAGAALERALRIEPRNAGIWHDLAQIRLHQGQYQQAESLASKSANLASSNRALQARNWKVIAAARKATGNMAGAEEAEARAAQFAR